MDEETRAKPPETAIETSGGGGGADSPGGPGGADSPGGPGGAGGAPETPDVPAGTGPEPEMPDYKGAPLDADRGPGLGCFWAQVIMLVALLVLTPLSVIIAAPSWLSATLLILILVLLFFVGQTMIFLLRLVAADRRTRRRPLGSTARATVGQLEDRHAAEDRRTTSDQDDATPDEPLT